MESTEIRVPGLKGTEAVDRGVGSHRMNRPVWCGLVVIRRRRPHLVERYSKLSKGDWA